MKAAKTLVSVNFSWFKFGLTRGIDVLNDAPFCFGGKITIGDFFARGEADVEKEKKKRGESCCVGAKHPGQVSSFNWSFLFQLDMIDCWLQKKPSL